MIPEQRAPTKASANDDGLVDPPCQDREPRPFSRSVHVVVRVVSHSRPPFWLFIFRPFYFHLSLFLSYHISLAQLMDHSVVRRWLRQVLGPVSAP